MSQELLSPLRPLPAAFPATVAALHRVAEQIVAPARKPDNEIALVATPGGFGTPVFEYGGRRQQVRVDGAELVHRAGDEERRAPLTTLDVARRPSQRSPTGDDEPLRVDPAARGSATGTRSARRTAEPDGRPLLWPEHFDIAIELGARRRPARQLRLLAGRRGARRAVRLRRPVDRGGRGRAVERDRLPRRRADLRGAAGGARPARRRARVLHDAEGAQLGMSDERHVALASRARGRRAAGGPRHDRRGRPQERRARPLRRAVLRARQPLPAPGRPARRGLDRERPAALPLARLRLLPARRQVARLRRRGDHLPARDPRRRGLRRRRGGARTSRPSPT